MLNITARNDLNPGDWIKMAGSGFDIYGKVVEWNPGSKQIQIVTSSFILDQSKMRAPPVEMDIEKIDEKDVPERARLWILARIKNPPDAPKKPSSIFGHQSNFPDTYPNPRRITGP